MTVHSNICSGQQYMWKVRIWKYISLKLPVYHLDLGVRKPLDNRSSIFIPKGLKGLCNPSWYSLLYWLGFFTEQNLLSVVWAERDFLQDIKWLIESLEKVNKHDLGQALRNDSQDPTQQGGLWLFQGQWKVWHFRNCCISYCSDYTAVAMSHVVFRFMAIE